MNNLKDLTGKRFGSWTVLERDGNVLPVRWICKCDCGTIRSVSRSSLNNGSTSCGQCKRNENPLLIRKHSNRLYHTWSEMRRRCKGRGTNAKYYEGKRISYCPEWENFDVFAIWALSSGYQQGLEIDRIDGDKDYSPENCRWVSHLQNSRNRKARSNNTTGTPGVQERCYKSGKIVYRVTITDGVSKHHLNIGTFRDLESAVKARKEAELKYWGFNIGE